MNPNAALCLCVYADLSWSRFPSEKRLESLEAVLQAAGGENRLQFCLTGETARDHAEWLRSVSRAGHGLDLAIHLTSPEERNDPLELEKRLASGERLFTQSGLSWWGICLPNLGATNLQDDPAALQLLMDQGVRWVAPLTTMPDGADSFPPGPLADDLFCIPGIVALAEAEVQDFTGAAIPGLGRLLELVESAARSGRILTLAFPLGGLARVDPQGDVLTEVVARAGELDLPLITLNEIADVTLARCQAGPQARDRVSVQQHLQFRRYWDTIIGVGQQAYKVYDYRGGWRLKPGYYRREADGWKTLPRPDPENGFQINRHGFRGPMFPHRRAPGERRILIVGDSCVFGVAGDGLPWPSQVQARLDELAGPGRLRVLNAGIEGQSSIHCRMRLDRLLTFEPDLVIVAVAANDLFIEDPATYVDTTGLQVATSWELVGEYPRERDILKSVGGQLRPMTPGTFYPYSYAGHLREMIRLCNLAGARPVLMTLPCLFPADLNLAGEPHRRKMHSPPFVTAGDVGAMRRLYESYNGAVREVAREEGVLCIDGEGFFVQELDHRRANLFSDTCHPTPEGNVYLGRFVAEQLWEEFQKEEERQT